MTFGFEREYFVRGNRDGKFVSASAAGLPCDGCGYLAEARGDFSTDINKAAALLLAEERRLIKIAAQQNLGLVTLTPQKLDKTLLFESMRQFGKSPQSDRSLSGKWNKSGVQHAGLHVHFGNQREIKYRQSGEGNHTTEHTIRVVDLFDIAEIIHALDKRYALVIKMAGRAPGLYKLQPHGFEYRSLPSDIDPLEVADFISTKGPGNWL